MKLNFYRVQVKRLWSLAAGVTLLAVPAWAADVFPLESIDFISSAGRTDMVLHTGSIVPIRKVSVSDDKLILEIEQIDAANTVQTNFAGAGNISHVVMQPLSDHKLRVIVRGENLGEPVVAFDSPRSQRVNKVTTRQIERQVAETGIPESLETGENPLADAESLSLSEEPVISAAAASADGATESSSNEEMLNLPLEPEESAVVPPVLAKPAAVADNMANRLLENALNGQYNYLLPYGLLATILGGLALFIRRKISKLGSPVEDVLEERAGSFRERAQAYRQAAQAPAAQEKPYAQKPERAVLGRRRASEPIGLGALKQPSAQPPIERESALEPAPQKPVADALMAAAMLKRKPAPAVAPKKQAVSQYKQNAAAPAKILISKNKKAKDPIQQELLRQEQVRAQEIARQPVRKPVFPPAKPQQKTQQPRPQQAFKNPAGRATPPSMAAGKAAQGPLPGNPQVVDFLRNVAELMEKEGKADLAQSIHKNLGTT